MTSRERVKLAFEHKEADKVPVDFGGMCCANINPTVVSELRDYYGLEKRLPKVLDMSAMTALLEPDLQEVLGCDVESVLSYGDAFGLRHTAWKEWRYRGVDVLIPEDTALKEDGQGGYFTYPEGDTSVPASGHLPANGFYFDNVERNTDYDEDELDPVDNIQEYTPVSDEQIAFHKKMVPYALSTGRAVEIEPFCCALGDISKVPGPSLKNPKGIRGIQDWYMAPLLYPDYVREVFEMGTDIAIENMKRYWEEFGSDIDIFYICGTDFGSQQSTMMSIDTFKSLYLPFYKKMNDWIHTNTTWKTLKHSCGAIYDLMPYFIEAGFDAINPVQCSAAGMDPERLKREFGKDILFWGGGVDTQKVLPFGTPEEVREQVLSRLEIFGKDGGYIFNTIHCIQSGTPVKNIVAMIDAVREYNGDK